MSPSTSLYATFWSRAASPMRSTSLATGRGVRMISAFEDGSDVGLDLIDLACLEERAKNPSPSFDQEVGHGALTEFGQEGHDWHAGLAREDDDLAAPCLEGMAAVGRGLPRDGDENGDFVSGLHEPAIQRQQRLAVENDRGPRFGGRLAAR